MSGITPQQLAEFQRLGQRFEDRLRAMPQVKREEIEKKIKGLIGKALIVARLRADIETLNRMPPPNPQQGIDWQRYRFRTGEPLCPPILTTEQKFDKIVVQIIFSPLLYGIKGYNWISENRVITTRKVIGFALFLFSYLIFFKNKIS